MSKSVVFWNTVFTVSSLFQSGLSEKGVEFPDDVVIGPELFSNGAQWERHQDQYKITLLGDEGHISNYVGKTSGYLVGFQWYNSDTWGNSYSRMKIQLYSSVSNRFTLRNETEWIDALYGGFQYYLFDQPIPMDLMSSAFSFHIGIMLDYYDTKLPIIYKDSCDGELSALYTTLEEQPIVGNDVDFYSPIQSRCESYSFQGIFVPTLEASANYGNCDMYVVKYHESSSIQRYQTSYGNSDPTCFIIRAEKPDLGIKFETVSFNVNCDNTVSIGDEASLSDGEDYSLWDNYCGTKNDIFDSKHANNPYVTIHSSGFSDSYLFSQGFEFSVSAEDRINITLIIVVGVVVGVIILGCIVAGIVLCICCCTQVCRKKTGTVLTTSGLQTGNISATPASGQTGASYPVQQSASYPRQQFAPQPVGPPPAYLPPIQGGGVSVYSNGNEYPQPGYANPVQQQMTAPIYPNHPPVSAPPYQELDGIKHQPGQDLQTNVEAPPPKTEL